MMSSDMVYFVHLFFSTEHRIFQDKSDMGYFAHLLNV